MKNILILITGILIGISLCFFNIRKTELAEQSFYENYQGITLDYCLSKHKEYKQQESCRVYYWSFGTEKPLFELMEDK